MQPDQTHTMPLPPDAYVAVAVTMAVSLEALWPLPLLPPASWTSPLLLAGVALSAIGFVVEVSAARILHSKQTPTHPHYLPTALVVRGVYRWSRNPFYCGVLIVVAGLMLAASLDWGVFLLPALWLALDRLVVPVEEQRLAHAFGRDYLNYAATTRRWL